MSRLLGVLLFSFLVPGAQDEGKKSKPLSREGGVTAPVLSLGLSLSVHGRDWPEGQLGNWTHLGHG